MSEGLQQNLVFEDEMGFNIWTARTRGRAKRGEPAVRIVEGQRGSNITVLLAVSPNLGLVHHAIRDGGVRTQNVADFISEVEALMASEERHVLICDNAPSHVNVEEYVSAPNDIRRLPRYSPFLNLAELANSALKAAVKVRLADPNTQAALSDRSLASSLGLSLHKHRSFILKTCIEQSLTI